MQLERDEFIFGIPVDTEYGKLRFLKYIEFAKYKAELYLINQNILHLYHLYRKMDEKNAEYIKQTEEIKSMTLLEIVCSKEDLLSAYITIFRAVFDMNDFDDDKFTNVIQDIFTDNEKFNYYRKLIQDMNLLIEDEVSEDTRVQALFEKSRKVKAENSSPNTILNIVTSLVLSSNHSFEDVSELTILQVQALYYKLGQFKNYDTSTLFATVSGDVKIESWATPPELFKADSALIDGKEFKNRFGKLAD